MNIGMIGLGKMGFNLVSNMLRHGHQVAAYDVNPEPRQKAAELGAIAADSIEGLYQAAVAEDRVDDGTGRRNRGSCH